MQILATEHWSLLASRSLGYTDSFSRANMFFSVLSGTVIALALIAQAGRFDNTFFAASLILLPVVFFVGIVTMVRIGNLSAEDARWVMGMNRIRHAYMEMHPELRQYFITSDHDDVRGVMSTFGISAPEPGVHFFADVGHGMQTLPGMLGIIVAVVAGAWAALVGVALGADQPVAQSARCSPFCTLSSRVSLRGEQSTAVPTHICRRSQRPTRKAARTLNNLG